MTEPIKDGAGPAFPVYPRHEGTQSRELAGMIGLSKRELLAGMALQGLLANSVGLAAMTHATNDPSKGSVGFSKWAVQLADSLLRELAGEGE